MRFLFLLYMNEEVMAGLSERQQHELQVRCAREDDEMMRRGQLVVADALQGRASARCVRKVNGEVSVTDGPFAETKEQLGGFLVVEARDLDEAIRLAGEGPMPELGVVTEVRPIYDYRAGLEQSAAAAVEVGAVSGEGAVSG